MENGPFIDALPIKNDDFPGYVSHNQMVTTTWYHGLHPPTAALALPGAFASPGPAAEAVAGGLFRPNLFLTDAVLGQVLEMAQLDTETEASEVLWDAGLHHGK